MKKPAPFRLRAALLACVLIASCAAFTLAHGQIVYVTSTTNGTITQIDATSGAILNQSLVSGLNQPVGIAISGSDIFVANSGGLNDGNQGSIGEYTLSGSTVNASLITGLSSPTQIAVDGSGNLYIENGNNGSISQYTTSGAIENSTFVTGLGSAVYAQAGIAASGTNIYISDLLNERVELWNNQGTLLNYQLIQTSYAPYGLAVSGSYLYVAFGAAVSVAKYTTSGNAVNTQLIDSQLGLTRIAAIGNDLFTLIPGTNGFVGEYGSDGTELPFGVEIANPGGIAVAVIPEPSTGAILVVGACVLLAIHRRSRSRLSSAS